MCSDIGMQDGVGSGPGDNGRRPGKSDRGVTTGAQSPCDEPLLGRRRRYLQPPPQQAAAASTGGGSTSATISVDDKTSTRPGMSIGL